MYFCGCSPGRSSPSFQLLVMNPVFFMSFRKGMKKASHPAKQQIESSQLDNEGNDIDAVVEQINVSLVTIFLSNLSFCYEKMSFVQLSELIKEQHQNKPYCWYYIAEA